jgi:hypothetical protein
MRMARDVVVALGFAFAGATSWLLVAQGCTSNDATCPAVQASNYDRSCKVDSECIAVLEQDFCCPSAAVNVDAQSQYMADFDRASAACATKGCNGKCPQPAGPCCRDGICGLGAQCGAADGEGRTADAGGE